MPTHLSTFSSQFSPSPSARHYHPTLSIWLSVDPLADKYPGVSPYVYCADNPVVLKDPNGRDWFENEYTGDVYYARDYRKGDEHLIGGNGWKWLGANNVFGESADEIIYSNYLKVEAEIYSGDASIERAAYRGENAQQFMELMGYDFKKKTSIVYITLTQQMSDYDASGQPIYFYDRNESEYVLSSGYVPKNSSASIHKRQKDPYCDTDYGPYIRKTTWSETWHYSYNNKNNSGNNIFKELLPAVATLLRDFIPTIFK